MVSKLSQLYTYLMNIKIIYSLVMWMAIKIMTDKDVTKPFNSSLLYIPTRVVVVANRAMYAGDV